MNAELTVIIPVYNRAELVRRALDSVAAQSLRPLRLIIVDNASTDETPDVLSAWQQAHEAPDFHITVTREPRSGAAAARKCGERLVETEYVYFLDSDDALRPDACKIFVDTFRRHPKAQLVGGNVYFHGADGSHRIFRRRNRNLIINHFNHSLLRTIAWCARTDFLRACGGWDPALRIWDDWELGLRMLLQSPRVIWKNIIIADVFQQPGSVTGDLYSHRADAYPPVLAAMRRCLQQTPHPDRLRLLRLMHSREMMLASLYQREGRRDLAAPLRERVLKNTAADPWLRTLLRFSYRYRAAGLPGADILLALLL